MNTAISSEPSYVRALLHRWFVQYNPLYLLSAVLVLVGVTLVDDGLARSSSTFAHLAVGVVTETYAVALVAGAAALTRLGLRRPAVFVALIAVLYQGDLALCSETYALHGALGKVATTAWLLLFAVKLRALAWALRLELSRSAFAIAVLGASGVALIPPLSRSVEPRALGTIVGFWAFSVCAAALWTSRRVTSLAPLDAWGRTVLRRSLRAAWSIWGLLAAGHVVFWIGQYHLRPSILAPAALLLATRWMRREGHVLLAVATTVVFAARCVPHDLASAALMAAVVLALHALRRPVEPDVAEPAEHEAYRGAHADVEPTDVAPGFAVAAPAVVVRQLAWAGWAVYLAAWTWSWSGGPLPAHAAPLDLVASLAAVVALARVRVWVAAAPLLATWAHWAIQTRLVRAPQSTLQWGVSCVGAGFGLLLASLVGAWWLERTRERS